MEEPVDHDPGKQVSEQHAELLDQSAERLCAFVGQLTSMTVEYTEEVTNNVTTRTLDVEDGGVRIFHADSPALHLGDGVEDGGVAVRRRGLLRDGL